MKLLECLAAILLFLLIVTNVTVADEADVEKSALEFQATRFKAMIDADMDSLEGFLADELTYTHNTGWVETKSEFMSTIASGSIDYRKVTPSEVKVRIYGEIAVMTGLSRMQGAIGDKAVSFTIRFTDVSKRIGDSWQLVAWQSAMLPEGEQ